MKKYKDILMTIIGLALILVCMICLDINYKKAIKECSKMHDAEYCMNVLAR